MTDLFADVRVVEAPASVNFSDLAHLSHAEKGAVGRENPQKTAMSHASHLSPPEITRGERYRGRIAELSSRGVTRDWAAALAAIEQMPMPAGIGMTPERWQQIIYDAGRLITAWHARLTGFGWSVADLFGLDDDEYRLGLVFRVRGGQPLILPDGRAAIDRGDRVALFRAGGIPADTTLIWTAFKREKSA